MSILAEKEKAANGSIPMVKVQKLCCKSGHRYLLKDITWEIYPGERWLVFGMNGSGKTTLLSIIAGFKQHTEGTVEFFGHQRSNKTIMEERKSIGFVSSSFFGKLYHNESALTIILSSLTGTLGIDGDIPLEKIKKAKELLEAFGLAERADYPFFMFSKGEQQNILIARAMIGNPSLLILDEPCSGLDIYNREYLFTTLADLDKRQDLAIVYVTHYTEEIMPMFEKSLLLKGGLSFRQGKTKELFTAELFSEYLDYPTTLHYTDENGYRIKLTCNSKLTDKL